MKFGKVIEPYCYTDYPILPLGDESGEEAPVRRVWPIAYDGDKYVIVVVSEGERSVIGWIKAGYLFKDPITLDEALDPEKYESRCDAAYDVDHLEVGMEEFLSIHVDWS